ncbi:MAG TPA: hypothetical protein VI409_06020 [Gaiellaceae bacterium]|nr:hypothetical protein [Gaiellaceae bacterium]
MYDPLTSTYSFSCPQGREAKVPLSSFRVLERLPGAAHPAVYTVSFACGCGDEHPGLVSHDDLDWAHLGTTIDYTFRNFMTARDDPLALELADVAASRIGAGEWPWSFFCFLEGRPRPVTPSAFALIAPGGRCFGVAVRCPACSSVSVNLVTREHVDIPFWNDASVGVIGHVFERDALRALADLRAELESAHFDERRLDLEL